MCRSNGQWYHRLPECHSTFTFNHPWVFSIIHCFIVSLFCSSAVIDCAQPKSLLNGGFEYLSGFQNQYQSVIKYHCNNPFYAMLEDKNGEIFIFSKICHNVWRDTSVSLNLYVNLFSHCSSVNFTCEGDRKWRSFNDIIVSPTCLPGISSSQYRHHRWDFSVGTQPEPDAVNVSIHSMTHKRLHE